MATVFDLAAFLIHEHGAMTSMKLQKLIYYAQAWSLAWDRKPIFTELIKAWDAGPVVPAIWYPYRGLRHISAIDKHTRSLSQEEQDTVHAVLQFYAQFDGETLSEITHRETPWRQARAALALGQGSGEISQTSIQEYYQQLSKEMGYKTLPETYARGLNVLLSISSDELSSLDEIDSMNIEDRIQLLSVS